MNNKNINKYFATVGEAVDYCSRFGLNKSTIDEDLINTAKALHKAFSIGAKLGSVLTDEKFIYVDGMGDADLMKKIDPKVDMFDCPEFKCDALTLIINYLDGSEVSNTCNPTYE